MDKVKMCLFLSCSLVILVIINMIIPGLYIFNILAGVITVALLVSDVLSIIDVKKSGNKITNDFIIIIVGTVINIFTGLLFGSFLGVGILFVLIGIPGLITYEKK